MENPAGQRDRRDTTLAESRQSRQTTSERTLTFALSNFELQEGRQAHITVQSNVHVPWNAFHGKHFVTKRSLETMLERRMGKDV